MKAIVIYHDQCIDGYMAARVMRYGISLRYDMGEPVLIPARYGDAPPFDEVGPEDAVFVVDFSYPWAELEELLRHCGMLRVLDHHASARETLEGRHFCTFDMERSGAGLAWDYCFPPELRPWAVNYIEDRDLWRFALPKSKEVNAYIGSLPMAQREYDTLLFDTALPEAKRVGHHLSRQVQRYVDEMIDGYAQRVIFHGYKVYSVNCPHPNCSELLGELARRAPSGVAIGWSKRADGDHVHSVRSRGDFAEGRALEIATDYAGGGHPNAAGFRTHYPLLFAFVEKHEW